MKTESADQNHSASGDGISILVLFTAVLWLGCLFVGAVGFIAPYSRLKPAYPSAPVVVAQLLKVELTAAPATSPVKFEEPPQPASPPPLAAAAALPPAPQLLAVAQPSPAVASATRIEAPVRIVEVSQAAVVRQSLQPARVVPSSTTTARPNPPSPAIAPEPAVQTLTFGQGEGVQTAPSYPEAARRAGQEGTVVIRFSVGADGRVTAVEPIAPSPWSALNREALRVVREQWRFMPGTARICEVAIRFELKK